MGYTSMGEDRSIERLKTFSITHDARLGLGDNGTVNLKMGEIVPATNRQTTAARRKRLRAHLNSLLAPYGWKELRPNVYQHSEPAEPRE